MSSTEHLRKPLQVGVSSISITPPAGPWISRRTTRRRLDQILTAQIRHCKPDVLVNGSIHWSHEVYREIRPYVRLLVGLHGAPLPAVWDPNDAVLRRQLRRALP